MATHLGQPLQVVQSTTTSKEFVLWITWLRQQKEKEVEQHSKQDFYMAALTAEVRRSWVKKPNNVKADMFLIKFGLTRSDKDQNKSLESLDSRMQKSKAAWSAILTPCQKGKK